MTTRNVHEFCLGLWEAREQERLPAAPAISRGLALAVAADVEASEDYEPHLDLRVVWAERMVKGRRWQVPERRPEASGAVEAAAAYLLGKPFERELDGRERAAGEMQEARIQIQEESEENGEESVFLDSGLLVLDSNHSIS